MKEYKVIPYVPIHNKKGPTKLGDLAQHLERNFQSLSEKGWHYVRIETIRSHVPAKGGCFGMFQSPAHDMSNHFIIFSREV